MNALFNRYHPLCTSELEWKLRVLCSKHSGIPAYHAVLTFFAFASTHSPISATLLGTGAVLLPKPTRKREQITQEINTTGNVSLRRIVGLVALLNLAYFGVEFAVARAIGSVSLFADSIDFLEDAAGNLLILIAIGWSARSRARLGMMLALILLVPGLATLWTAWAKFAAPVAPDARLLTITGLGALAINLTCTFMLARYRHHGGSLTRAAFLSARNDALANIAIIAAGLVTALLWRSVWPDLVVGLTIALMNADAAREVWEAAREEHRSV